MSYQFKLVRDTLVAASVAESHGHLETSAALIGLAKQLQEMDASRDQPANLIEANIYPIRRIVEVESAD